MVAAVGVNANTVRGLGSRLGGQGKLLLLGLWILILKLLQLALVVSKGHILQFPVKRVERLAVVEV